MPDDSTNFRYLNRDGRWRDFSRHTLSLRQDDSLQLPPVPRLDGAAPDRLDSLAVPDGLSGIAIDWDDTVYLSDTAGHRILRTDGCGGDPSPVVWIGAALAGIDTLDQPRGLVILPRRRALVVVDSGHHRVVLFDLASGQVVSIWGQSSHGATGQGSEPGQFATPLTAAADADGNVYVLDYGNQRVQRFDVSGNVDPTFWEAVRDTGLVSHPADLAVYSDRETWIYIRDEASHAILAFDASGRPRLDANGSPLRIDVDSVAAPLGLAATAGAVYVGDNATRAVLQFAWTGDRFELAGAAFGYHGPVAALALDGRGRLFVHTGAPPTVPLLLDAAYGRSGVLWSGAISVVPDRVDWFRLSAIGGALPVGAHLQCFTRTSDQVQDPPVDPSSDDPFPAPHWQRQAPDVTDFYLGGAPARYLWVAVRFSGDGLSTPVLSQLRVEFNHCGYEQFLPAIYRSDAACGDFLVRFLGLFESFFAEEERTIAHLPDFFDPAVVPDAAVRWLAEWLAVTLDEEDDLSVQRRAIAEAFSRYGRRGTVAGLREALRLEAHVDAAIHEPILQSSWWALPSGSGCACSGSREPAWTAGDDSILGFSTVLAAAYPQGAVLGTTAVLDQSHVSTSDEFAAALFDDVAHQFTVRVHGGDVRSDETRARIEEVIAREKPAHTIHHVCIVEPRMRVGFQARVGIDTVVGGGAPPAQLGRSSGSIVLGGEPRGRVGERSTVGTTTRL
jgi:phage tail-like protein